MPNDLNDAITNYSADLPEALQEVLLSAHTTESLQAIGQRHKIFLDKMEVLFAQVGEVLMGFTHPRDFPRNLSKALGISIDQAAAITTDINRDILDPIRKELEATYERNQVLATPSQVLPQALAGEETVTELPHITRDDLLAEIENPVPTNFQQMPTRVAPTTSPTTAPVPQPSTPVAPVINQAPSIAPMTTASGTTGGQTDKLTGTTVSTPQTSVVTPSILSKTYPTDPYREPIE